MKVNKIIEVEFCDDCPFFGKCEAWRKLTSNQRVRLTISNGVREFILLGCKLKDGPDYNDFSMK